MHSTHQTSSIVCAPFLRPDSAVSPPQNRIDGHVTSPIAQPATNRGTVVARAGARSARARSLDDPANTIHSMKRFMGRSLSDVDAESLQREVVAP